MTDPALVEEYLALTRQALTPPAALRERVQARLQGSAAPALVPGAALAPEPGVPPLGRLSSSGALMRGGGKRSWALSSAFLGLGFVAGYWLRPDAGQPPPLPQRLVAPAVTLSEPALALQEAESPGLPVLESARPRAPARNAAHAAAPVRGNLVPQPDDVPTSAAARGQREELALLQRAERAVRAGNSAVALMLTDELEARYPRSELLEERRAIELMAHCVARASDARPRAERFLRDHPRTVYAERITALCRSETAGSAAPSR